ncbi:MAG: beta-ketoacyl-[acyl-carrier-protein] synthase family protein [Planctomycetota bacterium]
MDELARVVITGVGLTSPNGNSLAEMRANLLAGVSGVRRHELPRFGETLAGVCDFDALRHQGKKELRRGTRAGSIAIWCAREALADAGVSLAERDTARFGVYVGITEHGTVETEREMLAVAGYEHDLSYWSHHHNPRTVANNPAGEISLSLGVRGPAYTLGGACAAGNLGLIHAVQMVQLGEVDAALGGGVSEAIHGAAIFASFRAQGALAAHPEPARASRPFDRARNGIVIAEGGCLFAVERLEDARARGATIHGEVIGGFVNSDAKDFVHPDAAGQNACIRGALARAGLPPEEIDLVSTHATSTVSGDIVECQAIREVFSDSPRTFINNTKSYIGHAMGAAGALELAGNLPSLRDGIIHPTINLDDLDPACELRNLVANVPCEADDVRTILNMSFGMLGINSAVVVRRCDG